MNAQENDNITRYELIDLFMACCKAAETGLLHSSVLIGLTLTELARIRREHETRLCLARTVPA